MNGQDSLSAKGIGGRRGGAGDGGDGDGPRSLEDSDFSHLDLKLDEELNLDLLGSMITDQSPGGSVATHLGTPMVQTVAAADFLSYVLLLTVVCLLLLPRPTFVGALVGGEELKRLRPWRPLHGILAPACAGPSVQFS